MRKFHVFALSVFMLGALCSLAAGDVPIDEDHFPDHVFRSYVMHKFDADGDNVLSTAEAQSAESMSDLAGLGISSLEGIEHFTNLAELDCSSNSLTSLDLSRNTALTIVWCAYNSLETLNVRGLENLLLLECGNNNLRELDISGCGYLIAFSCVTNNLTSLNIRSNPYLTTLYCGANYLTDIDLSGNTALTDFQCQYNLLNALDLSRNTSLVSLDCSSNDIAVLDLSRNTSLASVNCAQDLESLYSTPSGNSQYPFKTDIREYTGGSFSRIKSITAYSPDGTETASSFTGGVLLTASQPARVIYEYDTGLAGLPMNVSLTKPSRVFLIPRSNNWLMNINITPELMSAVTGCFSGTTDSDVRTFNRIIVNESWSPGSEETSALSGAGEKLLFTLPEVKADSDGIYVILCTFSYAAAGDPVSVYALNGTSQLRKADSVFIDTSSYKTTGTVPQDKQGYLAVKLGAGETARLAVTSSSAASPSGQSSESSSGGGGCEAGFGLWTLCAVMLVCSVLRKRAGLLALALAVTAASCSYAEVSTSDYALPIPFDVYAPAGTCTSNFAFTDALAEKTASEWPSTLSAENVRPYSEIALPGSWNLAPADFLNLSDIGMYGAAMLPLTASGTGGKVYVTLCTFSDDVEPGELIEVFGMSIDVTRRENITVIEVGEETSREDYGGANFVILDESLNRISVVPRSRKAYIAVSLSDTVNTGVITVVRGRYVAEDDPLSRIDPTLAQLIADDFGIDVSELKYLSQESVGSPRNPTEAMRQYVASNDREIILNMPTVSVDQGYKAVYFRYTLPDDVWAEVQGKSFSDYTVYALNDDQVSASGQIRSSGIITGLISLWELSGGKMNKFSVKEFMLAGLLQSGQPFSLYLAKMILALLTGGGCHAGINPSIVPLVILGLIVLKFPRKR